MTKDDLRPQLKAAYEQAVTISTAVRQDQLGGVTPCAEMDVSDLLDHLVFAARRAAALGHGEAPAIEQRAPHVELAEIPEALRAAAASADAGWGADSSLDQVLKMPWGEEYEGRTLVGIYLVELTTHTWDVAFATGTQGLLDDTLGAAALACAQATIRSDYRNDAGNPFGPELAAPHDATDWERLGAFMGRVPR